MRKTCRLCKSTISTELSERCNQCEGRKDCPLLAESNLCVNCRDKIESREGIEDLKKMYDNLSHDEQLQLVLETKALHMSMITGKILDTLSNILDIESGKPSSGKPPLDLFEHLEKQKQSGRKPEEILPNLFSMGLGNFPGSCEGKRPPFMNN